MTLKKLRRIGPFRNENFDAGNDAGFTRAVWNDASSQAFSGDSFATFLLGTPSTGNAFKAPATFNSSWYVAPWFQDDWKITNKLTLNLGLRYDFNLPPYERFDRLNIGFDPNIANPVSQSFSAATLAQYPQLANLSGGLQFAGVNGNRRTATLPDLNNIQPRIGVAYQVTPKLVFRGGYGLFYTNFQSNNILQTLGFSSTTNLVSSLDGGQTPVANALNNPFPSGLLNPTGSSLGAATYLGQGFTSYNPFYKLPRSHQFSAGFQYRITKNGVLDFGYVGNLVRAYSAVANANLPNYGFAGQCDPLQGGTASLCAAQVANPFQNNPAFAGTNLGSANTISAFNANRPFPQFGDINNEGLNIGKVNYNGFQIGFIERLAHGLTINTNYVFSKQIEQWGWINQYQGVMQRSPYLFNHPHVFKLSAVYELPVGRNRMFKLGGSRALDVLLGGWQVAPVISLQSGEPASLPGNAVRRKNSDVADINWNTTQVRGWGNCVLNVDANNVMTPMAYSLAAGCGTDPNSYDWMAYQTLAGTQAGPSNSGQLRMKFQVYTDLQISKTFTLWEQLHIDLNAQANNVLNHYNILTARFNTDPFSPAFGTVFPATLSTRDAPPRILQIGAKLVW